MCAWSDVCAILFAVAFILLSSGVCAFAQNSSESVTSANEKEEHVYTMLKQAEPLIKEKSYVQARSILKEAATLDPNSNSGITHSHLAYVAQQLGDLEGAIEESQLAMKFEPKLTDLTWNIAIAYKDLGDYDKSREWVQKYLETNPSDPKRVEEARGLYKKLGEQAGVNSMQSIRAPDYLDALVMQHGAGRWPRQNFPLKIFVEKSEGVPGVPEDSMAMIESAFDSWNSASGGLLPVQIVAKSKQADITIKWTNKPDKVSAHDGVHMEQGITRVMTAVIPGAQIGTIRSAEIMLLTVSRQTGDTIPPDEMKGVVLHEAGHALGLGGHSANSADTMYFSTSARQLPALSRRDKTTIARLYSSMPQNTQQMPFAMSNNRSMMPPFSQYQQGYSGGNQFPPQRNFYSQPTYTARQPNPYSGNMQGAPPTIYQQSPFGYGRNPYMQNNMQNGQPPYGSVPLAPFQQPAYQQPGYQQPAYQQPYQQNVPFPQAAQQQAPYQQQAPQRIAPRGE